MLLILKELFNAHPDVDISTLKSEIKDRFPKMSIASKTIVIEIFQKFKCQELNEIIKSDIEAVSIQTLCPNVAHFDYFKSAAQFAYFEGNLKLLEILLTSNPNAIRAGCIFLSFLESKSLPINLLPLVKDILITSKCDETRIGAVKILLQYSREELEKIGKENILEIIWKANFRSIPNSELIGLVLELATKMELEINGSVLLEGSLPHQHYLLRKSVSKCCVKMLENGKMLENVEIWQSSIILICDEDHEVRAPLEGIFGNVIFGADRKCRILD